jgi:uncharacterized protein (TIGR03437 family)
LPSRTPHAHTKTRRLILMRFVVWAVSGGTAMIAFGADPELKATAIVNAADHRGGAISPGEIVVLWPSNAGPASLISLTLDKAGQVMTTLGETRVLFDGQPAPLIYAIQGEIGAVVPFEVEGRMSSSVVVEYQGHRSPPVAISVVATNPAIFTQNRVGTGPAGILNDTGCCNSSANPAPRGTWVAVYATGTGVFEKRFPTGSIAAYPTSDGYPRPRLPMRLTVGGVPAELSFVAAAPHSVAGLLQINFRVPESAAVGNDELVLSVGNAESTSRATISVRSAKSRVLLASLEPATRTKWAAQLARSGYEVVKAEDLTVAMALASERPIDLAIVELPKTGASPAAWITSLTPVSPGMKILVMASQADTDSLRAADSLGANGFAERREPSAVVLKRIRHLLQRHPTIYDAGPPWPLLPH